MMFGMRMHSLKLRSAADNEELVLTPKQFIQFICNIHSHRLYEEPQ